MIWLTADLHFGHKNISGYCNRPYASVAQMDEALATNWRQLVKPEDTVYVLGDLGFSYEIPKLPGHIVLVRGNHDSAKQVDYWMRNRLIHEYVQGDLVIDGVRLNHIPVFDGKPMYCGHVHEKWRKKDNCLNVGVDVWGYKPITLQQARRYLAPTLALKVRKLVGTLFGMK